ncbi:hypothetical protein ACFORG_06080 [Lutimaribacter marinistellae]|uniref:Uncharacterized protein n=1 Tax=Lutimaribacter marinistellae TaxID=1820329 RepID=A0ABV7TDN0_9RHOB
MKLVVLTTIVTAVIATVLVTVFLHMRVMALASVDFRVTYPEVPVEVTEAVRSAEAQYYASLSMPRRLAEEGEDILALLWPAAVKKLDFSVGPYRIKASTMEDIFPWAISAGYLVLVDAEPDEALASISYFSEQPALADWGASLVLEHLRLRHPEMRMMGWDTIRSDPHLIAKLYSGYMGAGGDWVGWESSLSPGPEALRRMKLQGP